MEINKGTIVTALERYARLHEAHVTLPEPMGEGKSAMFQQFVNRYHPDVIDGTCTVLAGDK